MGGGAVAKTRSTLDFARSYFCEFTKSLAKVNCRRYAFTLAEVLITITVIGVVAALTIPNLVNNYQNKAWSTASVVFQRKLGEALKVMNSQGTLAGYSSTEDFVNELSKHIKINKICKNDEITSCFEDTVFWGNDNKEIDMKKIKLAANLGHSEWITNTLGVMFADGVSGIIAYNPECIQDPYRTDVITVSDAGIGTDCLAILYDTSGFKKPNTQSKDLRGLNVLSLDGESCVYQLPNGTCFGNAFKPTALSKEDCIKEQNELQIRECYWDLDYWAGAVKQCGGLDKLANPDQVAEIMNYIYNTDKIVAFGSEVSANLDYEKANELGFIVTTGSSFTIWNNSENHYVYSGAPYLTPTSAKPNYSSNRNNQNTYAVCIVE